jgi:hypothetical protein
MDTRALIIDGRPLPVLDGLLVRNYTESEVTRFNGKDRSGRPVTEVIVHETVTRSVASTIRVLEKRKLGVHLIVGPDGAITQHGDLARDRLAHAGGHNAPSVGIEVVNPYYPKYLKPDLPWSSVIEAPWAHKKRYVLPTPQQAEATSRLVAWLTSPEAEGLCIPRCWVGLADGTLAMGRVPRSRRRSPGIYAHHYFGHADGAWLILYAWLRIEAGLQPDAAYREATARAVGARRRVDLADLIEAGRRVEKE